MAGPPTAEHGQLTVVFTGPAMPNSAVCTLGLRSESITMDQALMLDLAGVIREFHKEMATNAVIVSRLELKRGPSETGPTFFHDMNAPGNAPGDCIPPNTAILIRKQLADISGRYAGRMFWPGYSESPVGNDGVITGASMTFITNACNKLFSDLSGLSLTPVVFGGPFEIDASTDIVKFVPQSRVATQRRRLRR